MKIDIEGHTIEWLIDENVRNHKKIYLPFYQRAYEWSIEQIESLFDSILNGYFFGSFLMMETSESTESLYNLLTTKEADKKIGELINTNSISVGQDYYCLIDGQQRLTSLIITLNQNGSYNIKKYNKQHKFYLYMYLGQSNVNELLGSETTNNPSQDEIGNKSPYFRMFEGNEKAISKYPYLWFNVSDITEIHREVMLAIQNEPDVDKEKILTTKITDLLTTKQLNTAETAISRIKTLYSKIYEEELASCVVLKDGNDEDSLETFIRLNTKGTRLSYSDLIISKMSAWFEQNWTNDNRRKDKKTTSDVKALIKNIIDSIGTFTNQEANFKLSESFVLKTFIVLTEYNKSQKSDSTTNEVDFKFSSLEKLNDEKMKQIYDQWDKISSCIVQTFKLINGKGVDLNGYFISSYNALIPIALYLYNQPNFNDNTWQSVDDNVLAAIKWYLLLTPLNKTFNSHTDGALKNLCDLLRNCDYDFLKFKKALSKDDNNKVNASIVSGWLDKLQYSKNKQSILSILSILYPEVAKESTKRRISIEHLHPETPTKNDRAKINAIQKNGKIKKDYDEYKHRLSNLSLVFQDGKKKGNSAAGNKSLIDKIDIHKNSQDAWTDEYLYCDDDVDKNIENCYKFWENRYKNIKVKILDFFTK